MQKLIDQLETGLRIFKL